MKSLLLSTLGTWVLFIGTVTISNAALVGRLPTTPGGTDYQAAYDTELGITWSVFDIATLPFLSWEDSLAWADSFSLGGHKNWRLPSMDVNGDTVVETCLTGVVCSDNELGHMHYFNLGGSSGENLAGVHTVDGVTFHIATLHWSSTEYIPLTPWAWVFSFQTGGNTAFRTDSGLAALAVTDGDPFAPVPIPGAVWLFGSGLMGLIGISRRKIPV